MEDDATSAKSKSKLDSMMSGFTDFEGIMRDATRVRSRSLPFPRWQGQCSHSLLFCVRVRWQQRRDVDQHRLEELKREMGGLEKDFTTEVQVRCTALHAYRACTRGLSSFGGTLRFEARWCGHCNDAPGTLR
jgi:hypothetical protein